MQTSIYHESHTFFSVLAFLTFSKVEVKSASLSKDSSVPGVTFEFALTYSKEAFSPDSKEIIIEVPKLTVSDSKDNAPVSLFEEGGDTSGKEQ